MYEPGRDYSLKESILIDFTPSRYTNPLEFKYIYSSLMNSTSSIDRLPLLVPTSYFPSLAVLTILRFEGMPGTMNVTRSTESSATNPRLAANHHTAV